MANFVGLAVARNAKAEIDVNARGLRGGAAPHDAVRVESRCTTRCRRWSGCSGSGATRCGSIPVDADFEIDVAALRRAIAEDRAAGHPSLLRRRHRRHGEHGRDRRPGRARGSVRRRKPVVPRRRRVRRAGGGSPRLAPSCAAWSAPTRSRSTCTSGCTCRTRRGARVRAPPGRAPRHVLGAGDVPGAHRRRARGLPDLAVGLRSATVARLPRAQGVDVVLGVRREVVRAARRAELRPGRATSPRASSASPSSSCSRRCL